MGTRIIRFLKKSAALHIGKLIGTSGFFAGLLCYRSYENRDIFERWSYPFFTLLLFTALALFLLAAFSLHAWKRTTSPRRTGFPGICLDLALFSWGLAYFISAYQEPGRAGRITDLAVFGSTLPTPMMLEWLSICLVFLSVMGRCLKKVGSKWMLSLLSLLSTAFFLLLLGEGIIRIKALVNPQTQGIQTYSSMAWRNRFVSLNAHGFRDEEHTIDEKNGLRRLLIVGDSYAFGCGIKSIDDRFGEQLTRRLAEGTGEGWEVINTSMEDTHTQDHIDFLQTGLAYNPERVVLLYVFNDIDYLKPVTPRRFLFYGFTLTSFLYKNSYLFQEAFVRLNKRGYWNLEAKDPAIEAYRDESLVMKHFRDLAAMAELCAEAGAAFNVVPFDILVGVEKRYRQRYQRFVNQGIEAGLCIWPQGAEFARKGYASLTVNELDRHPNEYAHALLAEEIAGRILTD